MTRTAWRSAWTSRSRGVKVGVAVEVGVADAVNVGVLDGVNVGVDEA